MSLSLKNHFLEIIIFNLSSFLDSPICRTNEPQVMMIDKNELVSLNCEYNADPTELQFSWTLNYNENTMEEFANNNLPPIGEHNRNQSEMTTISKLSSYYSKQLTLTEFVTNHTQSMLNYVINERNTYGEIHCHSSNSLGSSVQPCRFIILPHGPPCVPSNCDLKNTINEIILNCEHCDQLTASASTQRGKGSRARSNLNTIHMLTGSMANNDIVYNLKVYMPINNADLIRKPNNEWSDQMISENSENSILNNAHKQEETGLIRANEELKTTDPMKFQGNAGQAAGAANNFNPNTALLIKNLTNPQRPQFKIGDLKPATVYLLFLTAINGKGASEVRSFSISTLGSPERQLAMGMYNIHFI